MGWTSVGAVTKVRGWTKWSVIVGSAIFLLASPRDAAAQCQGGGPTQTLSPGDNLIDAMLVSQPGCTLSLNPGIYVAPSGTGFQIPHDITVRAAGAPGSAVLQVEASQFSVISIWPLGGSCPSGATVEGLTLSGGAWGIFAGADPAVHVGCAGNQISGLTLRNLTLNPTGSNGHVIDFHAVQNSVIDSVTVLPAPGVTSANGIFIESGSHNNIVMNSQIGGSYSQHAIAIQSSSDNVIVGNTISVATAFDGIHMNADPSGNGNLRNRIERNLILGHRIDGILVNDNSHFNYVGLNTALSSSYTPGSATPPSQVSGTGIWVNNGSNANYLLGNDVSGSPENGIDILRSKSTFLAGNAVHGNWQGGIWVANVYAAAPPSAPAPQDTVLQGNNLFFNSSSGQLFLQGASNSQAAFNYLSGAQGGVVASNHTVAFGILDSAGAGIFENTVSEVGSRAIVQGSSSSINFFRNRFLKGTNVPNPPQTDGRNGVTYAISPNVVQWDGGSFLGGNHWSEFPATGNPDPSHPYAGFIGTAGNVDRFPYQSETLQTLTIPNSVSVLEPVAGSVLAAGSKKTVRWIARGCSLVDLYYASGAGTSLITAGYPNTGYYFWTVPPAAFRSDYVVHVGCADSNGGALGVAGNSPVFTIATGDLVLLNPGRATRAANGANVRVAWKASAAVTSGVQIYAQSGSAAETLVATAPAGTTVWDITLPGSVSNSSRVRIRIQDAASSSRQDSVDGYFMVRGTAASFTTDLTGQALVVGDVLALEWNGTSDSYTVDLDLVGGTTTSIVRNLTDFGNYTWLVPDAPATTAFIRATFKNAAGATVNVVTSGAFSIARGANVPPPPPTNTAPIRRDFDGDGKTELHVFRPANGTWYVRYSSLGYAGNDTFQWGLPGDIPISADFDGDGRIELTVYRPGDGTWYIRFSTHGYAAGGAQAVQWGLPGDVPVVADFDGDGRSELTVYRPSNGTWYIRFSTHGYSVGGAQGVQWGLDGDLPIAGDFDGDGRTDLTVFRPSTGTWYVRYSSLNYSTANAAAVQWGLPGDIPLVTDFDGDGRADLTVFRPASGVWFILHSSSGYASSDAIQWGLNGDVPVSSDFDGDGKTDLVVFRPANGTWYIRYSTLGYVGSDAIQWGLPGDELAR